MVVSDRQLQRWRREVWLWATLGVIGFLGAVCLFGASIAFFVDMFRDGYRSVLSVGEVLRRAGMVLGCWVGSRVVLDQWVMGCSGQLRRIHLEMKAVLDRV